MHMQSAVVLQQSLHTRISELNVDAVLGLSQNSPLHCYKRGIDTIYNYSIIEDELDLNSYKVEHIIKEYSKRNSKYFTI